MSKGAQSLPKIGKACSHKQFEGPQFRTDVHHLSMNEEDDRVECDDGDGDGDDDDDDDEKETNELAT